MTKSAFLKFAFQHKFYKFADHTCTFRNLYFDNVAFAVIFCFLLHLLQWLVWEAFPAEHSPAEVQAFWSSARSMCGHWLAEHPCPHNGKKPLQWQLCYLAFQSMSSLDKHSCCLCCVLSTMLAKEGLEQPFSNR